MGKGQNAQGETVSKMMSYILTNIQFKRKLAFFSSKIYELQFGSF